MVPVRLSGARGAASETSHLPIKSESPTHGKPVSIFQYKALSARIAWLMRPLSAWTCGLVFFVPSFAAAATLTVSAPSGQTYDVSGNETYSTVTVGNAANETGTINVNAGTTLTTGTTGSTGTFLGHVGTATGTINVSGAGAAFTDNGSTYIGELGTGAINVSAGGTMSTGTASTDTTWLGSQAGASGTVTVDGTGSSWTSNASVTLGQPGAGTGAIQVQNGGGAVVNGSLNINDGTITTTGSGSTFTANNGGNIGSNSQFVVSNGAVAKLLNNSFYMNGNAALSVTGASTSLQLKDVAHNAWLMVTGGNISVTNGAYLYTDGGYIGNTGALPANMTVSGANTRWDSYARIYVGGQSGSPGSGVGKLVVSGGAVVTSATGGAGLDAGSSGTIILTGQGTTFSATANPALSALGNFYVSYGGNSDVLVTDGALLNADHHISIASVGGSTGILSIGAAKGATAAAPGTITTPTIDFGTGTGELVFNHTSSNYQFAPSITGAGAVGLYAGTTGFTGNLTGYTGTMTVDGGTLAVANGQTLSLGGNYQQTAAGTLQLGDATSKMAVTGTATFGAGSNIQVDTAGLTTLASGETLSSVVSAGTLNASTFNVLDNSLLFDFSAAVNGNAVDLHMAPSTTNSVLASVNATGLNEAQGAAKALDGIIASGTTGTDMASVVTSLGRFSTKQQVSSAAAQTLPLLVTGTTQIAADTLHATSQVIQARQSSFNGLSSGDGFLTNKGAWIKPVGSWAHQKQLDGTSGYSADSYGLIGGVDGNVSDNSSAGFALSYMNVSVDGRDTAAGSHATIDAFQGIAYGSYTPRSMADVEVNWQADLGINRNTGHRDIGFLARTAHASYDSYTGHLGLGLARAVRFSDSTTVIPSIRADYSYIRDGGYTETGAGALNLKVDSNSNDALIMMAGAHLSHALSERINLVASAGVGYDALNRRASLTSTYIGGGTAFTTQGINLSPWLGRGGVGATFRANERTKITASYDVQKRSGFLQQTGSIKLRWLF